MGETCPLGFRERIFGKLISPLPAQHLMPLTAPGALGYRYSSSFSCSYFPVHPSSDPKQAIVTPTPFQFSPARSWSRRLPSPVVATTTNASPPLHPHPQPPPRRGHLEDRGREMVTYPAEGPIFHHTRCLSTTSLSSAHTPTRHGHCCPWPMATSHSVAGATRLRHPTIGPQSIVSINRS